MKVVREAAAEDVDAIRAVHLGAFAPDEREDVAKLAEQLLSTDTTPPVLSLVAEERGQVVAHAAFSPVWAAESGSPIGYLLGPLGVATGQQHAGFGSALVTEGMTRLRQQGVALLFVYGNPAYYGRFGFESALAESFEAPYALTYAFGWLGLRLAPRPAVPACRLSCVAALNRPELW